MILLYTVYCEIDRGLFPLSFLLYLLLFYLLLYSYFMQIAICQLCTIAVTVTIFYLGYMLFNLFLDYLFNLSLPMMDMRYVIYILSDILVIVVFL